MSRTKFPQFPKRLFVTGPERRVSALALHTRPNRRERPAGRERHLGRPHSSGRAVCRLRARLHELLRYEFGRSTSPVPQNHTCAL
jgi:hypothetical protein